MTSTELARRRRRPAPSIPEQKIRAYCPACHEVQRAYGQWRALYGTHVRQHFREVVALDPRGGDQFAGEAVKRVRCPGGDVDLIKDRAP